MKGNIITHLFIPPTGFQMSLLVGLPESSGGRARSFTQTAKSSPWLSTLTCHLGDEQ
jgi:hypothetical protein